MTVLDSILATNSAPSPTDPTLTDNMAKQAASPTHNDAEVNITGVLLAMVGIYIIIYLLHGVERVI